MIWNFLLITVAVVAAWLWWRVRDFEKSSYEILGEDRIIPFWMTVAAIGLSVVSFVGVGTNANNYSKYNHSVELLELKTSQRDGLADLVQQELSLEQYEAVMAATPQTDILIILGNNAALFLVEKTRLLVGINNELNVMVNELANDRIDLCAWAENPLTPRLPFISPKCPDSILQP